MAHQLDNVIPEWNSIDALYYHRILLTQIPGNHDASEACPTCGCSQKDREATEKLNSTRFRKEKKRYAPPEGPEARKPQKHMEQSPWPLLASVIRFGLVIYSDNLTVKYAKKRISSMLLSPSQRRLLCWWESKALPSLQQTSPKLLKETKANPPKDILSTRKKVLRDKIYVSSKLSKEKQCPRGDTADPPCFLLLRQQNPEKFRFSALSLG